MRELLSLPWVLWNKDNASLCSLWPLMITSRECPSARGAGCCLWAQSGLARPERLPDGMLSPCLRQGD